MKSSETRLTARIARAARAVVRRSGSMLPAPGPSARGGGRLGHVVDGPVPELAQDPDRLSDVDAATDDLDGDVALDHGAQRLRADARGDVGGRDAPLLV